MCSSMVPDTWFLSFGLQRCVSAQNRIIRWLLTDIKAFTLLREFILGSNQTGLVTNTSGTVSVVGGESLTLAAGVLPGGEIFYGSGTTQSSYTAPSATVAAWNSFIATAALSSVDIPTNTRTPSSGHRTTLPIIVAQFTVAVIWLVLQ
jgi:hypothetical protein